MSDGLEFLLWGSAGHAKVLAELVRARGGEVVVLVDNDPTATAALEGVPVCTGVAGLDVWMRARRHATPLHGLVAIGGARGRDRIEIQRLLAARGVVIPSVAHPDASVSPSATLGAGSQVLARALVAAAARVGAATILNHGAQVDHECEVGDGVHLAPGAVLCGLVRVGDGAMVGAGAVVLPRLAIGADSIVGAGAVVTRDVPAGAVVAGNPARAHRSGAGRSAH